MPTKVATECDITSCDFCLQELCLEHVEDHEDEPFFCVDRSAWVHRNCHDEGCCSRDCR